MASLRRIPLPYHCDSCGFFSKLKHLAYPVFLDSAAPFSDFGRFDIICAQPKEIISLKTNSYDNNRTFLINTENRIKTLCNEFVSTDDLPFCGGAIGYMSYEFGRPSAKIDCDIEQKPPIASPPTPDFHVGVYEWAIVVDHLNKQCELVAQAGVDDQTLAQIEQCVLSAKPNSPITPFKLSGDFVSSLDQRQYRQAFNRVQDYIRAGDCYQINLTRAFNANYRGDPWQAYQRLRETAAAPFSVFMDLGNSQILSFSPERLLSARKGHLQTQPIKGTAARDPDPIKDQALAAELRGSEKNRAENVMIVDLLRNDFSKSCLASTVKTEKLCELQSFRTVHHLVSTVSGELRPDCTPFNALQNCFPGGSITGAPKRRAMEIIDEIEPHRRSVYCGSIFYLGADGKMDSNIAIRSFVCADNEITGWAGGGIVADSDADEEFIETETKIGKLLAALADL
ncbi:aminodeoxychorismate synthase component I [Zhongshania sp. BJYM1]|uniref:aminodeoxychorismate synthase component I n=1 Tax=Zhongshania aquatica TaxID=2965069 RepID=UPI0022B5BE45|nr:aminodeoxychorismate synthase component I [Marortus sp. BJYM1]